MDVEKKYMFKKKLLIILLKVYSFITYLILGSNNAFTCTSHLIFIIVLKDTQDLPEFMGLCR